MAASDSNAVDPVLRAAARLRITTDAKQGLVTPEWVRELASDDSLPTDEGKQG